MTASRTSKSMEEITSRITGLRALIYSVWFRFEETFFDISEEKTIQRRKVRWHSWPREVRSVWNDVVSEAVSQPLRAKLCEKLHRLAETKYQEECRVIALFYISKYALVVTVRTFLVSASPNKYGPYNLLELKPHQTVTFGECELRLLKHLYRVFRAHFRNFYLLIYELNKHFCYS